MSSQPHESRWPGERENPTRHDVEVANELPAPSFLSEFKTALAASPEAADLQTLMCTDLNAHGSTQQTFTYPLALLSDFPAIPTPAELNTLTDTFMRCCGAHVFLGRLPIPQPSRESVAPPLRLATACIASLHARTDLSEARDLFSAGGKLWAVMMEVDNRESRSLDWLVAVCHPSPDAIVQTELSPKSILLASYGTLSSDEQVRDMTAVILSASITITRRMRLSDSAQLEYLLGPRACSYNGAIVGSLWLVDILYGLHSDLAVSSFSTREIWTKMPSSGAEFQKVYNAFLEDKGPQSITFPLSLSQEDAVLLLMAILSDLLYIRRSVGQHAHLTDPAQKTARNLSNPFVPLSPHTETYRMQNIISSALDRWYSKFNTLSSPGMMAFYYYCRLYLSCPQILGLPHVVDYRGIDSVTGLSGLTAISDQSVQHAWRILDDAAARPKSDLLCPLWLPIFVFHAGLVVWAKQQLDTTQDPNGYGSNRILLPFKVELEGMPWPCCKEMAETLARLMAAAQFGGKA